MPSGVGSAEVTLRSLALPPQRVTFEKRQKASLQYVRYLEKLNPKGTTASLRVVIVSTAGADYLGELLLLDVAGGGRKGNILRVVRVSAITALAKHGAVLVISIKEEQTLMFRMVWNF